MGKVSPFDLLVLSRIPGIGQQRLAALLSSLGSPEAVYRAKVSELALAACVGRETAERIARSLKGAECAEAKRFARRQLELVSRLGGEVVSLWDAAYPELLRNIYDPPPLVFLRGSLLPSDAGAVAVVGTRSPTEYGRSMARRFASELASRGLTVVSGLARGIDTEAHRAVLEVQGGRTLAVLGSGLDECYPPENRGLLEQVAAHGAVLTEQCMGARPLAENFPRRNRIISGLSLGTLVVESPSRGGAMITARLALEQNREVFALPGSLSSQASSGCHALIREGRAKLVQDVEHVLEELNLSGV